MCIAISRDLTRSVKGLAISVRTRRVPGKTLTVGIDLHKHYHEGGGGVCAVCSLTFWQEAAAIGISDRFSRLISAAQLHFLTFIFSVSCLRSFRRYDKALLTS